MSGEPLIYVIDDDESVRTVMERYLIREGFAVKSFSRGDDAQRTLDEAMPDMVILDIMLPGVSGYDLCKWIRARSEVPIIMVSARDEEVDRILGLELGSDDYLSKPFSPRELVARVRTVFRRLRTAVVTKTSAASPELPAPANLPVWPECGGLILRDEERRITYDGMELILTTKEFELLAYLIKQKSKAFTREQLLTQVWGYDYIGDERAIDDLVKRLRKKLGAAGTPAEIVTVWGYGYKLEG